MGRKDASAAGVQAPNEQYRKQIGKQDWKKSKKEIKAQKRRADQQTQIGAWGALLVIMVFLLTMTALYGFLVWYLDQGPGPLTHEKKAD